MNRNKYLKLIFFDPTFRMRIFIFLAILFLMSVQISALKAQDQKMGMIKKDKELVLRIPNMEETIRANTVVTAMEIGPLEQLSKIGFNLRGMTIKNGVPYALIDDTIYTVGDTLGEFTIVSISRYGTVLENRNSKEIKKLLFPE